MEPSPLTAQLQQAQCWPGGSLNSHNWAGSTGLGLGFLESETFSTGSCLQVAFLLFQRRYFVICPLLVWNFKLAHIPSSPNFTFFELLFVLFVAVPPWKCEYQEWLLNMPPVAISSAKEIHLLLLNSSWSKFSGQGKNEAKFFFLLLLLLLFSLFYHTSNMASFSLPNKVFVSSDTSWARHLPSVFLLAF